VIVDSAVYEGGRRRDGNLDVHEAMELCRAPDCFTWIGLYVPTEQEFESIRSEFDLHPLAVEDAIHAHQRPKLEVFGDMVFIVLKTARYVDPTEVIKLGEILIFLGHDYILTVRHGEASELTGVRRQLEEEPDMLQHGPGAVLHAIVDRVVDDYGPALEGLSEDIDQVEDQVFSESRRDVAERIYKLKREVLQFAHGVGPLVDPVDRLARGKYAVIHPEVRTYFRDVNDHLLRAHDQLEGFRDLLTSILQANMTQVSVRQNEDMRKISAFVAMAVVPTLIAGIYGMNFEHMPELDWTFGYPAALALMCGIVGILYWRFRRAGWVGAPDE
jgi:magnesium transporter